MAFVRRYGLWILVAVVVLAVIGALTRPADDGGAGSSSEEATSDRCSPASAALLDAIETGLTVSGGGSLGGGQVVESDDFEQVYFVAARIEGEGMDDVVGVWATNSTTAADGLVFSAEAIAAEFSDWGEGPGFSPSDDGLSEARECAGG